MNLSKQDIDDLASLVNDGYVRKAEHPKLPLSIYNYSQKTQFEGNWNKITRQTRGLVLDDDYKIIVKCPEKFFNKDEPLAAKVNLANARISEKLDGYYISIKLDSDYGLIITSRGSFANQYIDAVQKFIPDDIILQMVPDYTYFCELLQNFPGDEAIILTKHPIPKLVCWAIRDQNFNEIIPDEECPFPIAKELSLAEAKQYLKQRVEGVVAQDLDTFERVKIKTQYFIDHHKILADCTKKRVWELLSEGKQVSDLDIPDEFMTQMKEWEDEIQYDYSLISLAVTNEYEPRKHLSDKDIALDDSLSKEMKTLIFTLKKRGKDALSKQIWQLVKPRNMV